MHFDFGMKSKNTTKKTSCELRVSQISQKLEACRWEKPSIMFCVGLGYLCVEVVMAGTRNEDVYGNIWS